MNQRLRRLILFIVGFAAGCSAPGTSPIQPAMPQQTSSVTVTGFVRERLPSRAAGLPITGVNINVYPKVNSTILTTATSDLSGRYSFSVSRAHDGSGAGVAIPEIYLTFSKEGYSLGEFRFKNVAEDQTTDLLLEPVLRTVTGIVTDPGGRPAAGVAVEITTGSNTGLKTTSDVSGKYTLAKVWGDFDLRASAAGYDATTRHTSVDAAVTHADIQLSSDPAVAHATFTGNLCTVATPYKWSACQEGSFPYPTEAHHTFMATRAGTLVLAVNYAYVGDYYYNYLTVRLSCDGQLIAEKQYRSLWSDSPVVEPDHASGSVQIALPRACTYDIGLSNYIADRKGGDWTTYRIDAAYPK